MGSTRAPQLRSRRRWKDLPVRTKGIVVVAAPIVPLLLMTVLVHLALMREARVQAAAADNQRLRTELQTALTLLVDAETSVRGYVLARDREFLEPFEVATRSLPATMASLKERGQTDSWGREQLVVVERLAAERLEILRAFIDHPEAVTAEALRESKRRMDGIRFAMQALLESEDRRTQQATEAIGAARRMTLAVVWAGAVLGVGGGIVAVVLFTSGITRTVQRLGVNVERLARGEEMLPIVASEDEIGRVKRRLHDIAAELTARDRALREQVDQIATANRELEAFSYSVSHDLRAPLRHIAGFSALLERDTAGELSDTGLRYVRTIRDAAANMGRLIDDLLAFSRMARAEMVRTEVDLNAIVADVVVELGRTSATRPIAWTLKPLPRVAGDRPMLRIVLMNLLSNAVKYTSRQAAAAIEVDTVSSDAGETVICVRDNGVGFDMAYADKLFGVFQRLHGSDEFEGTGIGLASVRRIVQRHGGRVWAEATPGAGAAFYVSLPSA